MHDQPSTGKPGATTTNQTTLEQATHVMAATRAAWADAPDPAETGAPPAQDHVRAHPTRPTPMRDPVLGPVAETGQPLDPVETAVTTAALLGLLLGYQGPKAIAGFNPPAALPSGGWPATASRHQSTPRRCHAASAGRSHGWR